MKRLLILCLVISTIFISVFLLFSCGSGSGSGGLIPFITSGSSSSSQGKISNNFSTSLNFDADNDGDIDSGYLMDGLINGGNQDDIIFSLASDNNLIYFTGESFNQSNLTSNMIVGKIDLEGNFLSFFNPGSNIPFEIQSQNGNMSSTGIDIQTNGQFVFSLGIATNQAGNKSFIMLSIFDKEATNISSSNVFITGASTENSLPADMSVIDNSIYVTGRS
ncbi:MAG: hypothetical protein NZM44_01490, partial [Candidatus Calescibacterium sp.]|nr:hypothetical protein [Candidatus Calescibacterium sp.]